MLWDRVFGTYFTPPERVPDMGLTGRPTLWMNPLRVALAGYLEVATELWRNPGWTDRLKILVGPTHYVPPVHVPYLIKPVAGVPARDPGTVGAQT